MILSRNRIILNYILTYLLIGFSGIGIFDENRIARMGFFLLLAGLFFYYKKKINNDLVILIAFSILIILFQTLYFGGGKIFSTFTMVCFLIITPYFAIKIIGPNILKYYRDIMVIISLISLVFWVAVNVWPSLYSASQVWAINLASLTNSIEGAYNDNYIIYTYEESVSYGIYENPGPFHEPGAFSVFLIFAMICEIFIAGKLLTKNNIIFFICLISAFSTAGFLGMFVLLSFYVYISKRMTLLTKVFVSVILFAVVIYLFLTLEFLGEKLDSQFREQTEVQLNAPTDGRFLGARKALIVLYRYPLFGRGMLSGSKADETSDEAAGYGWIMWVSRIGIIFGFIYMYFLYKALKNYSIINLKNKLFSLFAFAALLAVLSGQKHTSALLFFILFLSPIVFPLRMYPDYYKINE